MRAESFHIGLNAVNPSAYAGWSGDLVACEADARDLAAIARARRFHSTKTLLTRRATSGAVSRAIADAAGRLKPGDLFVLTYSGHGGQVPDTNGDESDGQDETWVLWDRQLVDDELHALLAQFRAGVRVFVLSDSCHSGTVTRERRGGRAVPPAVNRRNAALPIYARIQDTTPPRARAGVTASVILISGCQDNQTAADGDRNGLFTGTLLEIWDAGKFAGGHRAFRNKIAARMPAWQTPNYSTVGRGLAAFEKQTPFTP